MLSETELRKLLLETIWATHEALRRMGVAAESIYVLPDAGLTEDRVFVRARHHTRTVDVDVGRRLMPVEEFEEAWSEYARAIAEGQVPEEELQDAYNTWLARVDTTNFAFTVEAKLGLKGSAH